MLNKARVNPRRPTPLLLWAWLLAALLAVAGVAYAIERLAHEHLLADAQRSAIGWAHHVADHVPQIDRVFQGDLPGTQAREKLGHMLGMAGLFRFKLFAPDGRLLLISDDLSQRPPQDATKPAHSERARAAAGAGRPHVALKQGDGKASPPHYSEAYVPVLRGDRAIGVVEVYIDQSQLAAMTSSSFRRAALTASAGLVLSFAASALLWRWRAARERRTHERVRYLAHHDVLTGAVNHASFSESLNRACQQLQAARTDDSTDDRTDDRANDRANDSAGQSTSHGTSIRDSTSPGLALLCIDLDRFADVNEVHGHLIGDELLRMAAARLHAVLRGEDLLARLAGDRFAVKAGLGHGADGQAAVQGLAQRIIDRLAQPYELPEGAAGLVVNLTASVGAAVYGKDGTDADSLLHNAELAVLQAKAQGSARWTFYDATLDQALQDRRLLAADLRSALANGALRLHFQPIYGRNGQLLGYEALARWPHPTRGPVPPLTFVSVAEETGQIEALGRWVLHTACAEAASWPAQLSVAVNLSPAQFRGGGHELVAEVGQALQASGLSPRRLELEITESLLMNHTEEVLATLHAMHALGVRIAMDDFGTGYSSLAYLWRFPFDKLKIDRAFTQGLGHDGKVDVIVRSMVSLAHSLAIKVNAEGVETAAQRDALCRHGCDELQGFLFGKPLPPGQLVHLAKTPVDATPCVPV